MTNFKKKLVAGLLSGALLFSGGLAMNDVQAAQRPAKGAEQTDARERHERPQLTEAQINEMAQKISDKYGVNQSEVSEAIKNHVHFEDIKHAATLANISGRSFSEVLAMKCDWWQVAEKLGVTSEQFESFMKAEMLDNLVEDSKLDKKTVESLLKDNYDPRDICIAGLISNESGKNVKTVLSKRKVNNTWEDVAKEFNVDLSKITDREHGPKGKMHGDREQRHF